MPSPGVRPAPTLATPPPGVPGFTVAYHPLQSTYALTFTPQTFSGMRSFFGCAQIHIGTKDQADALHLYVPETSSFFRTPLAYTPAAGLYIVRQPPPPGQEQFRVYKLPTSPPSNPFALVDSERCTSDLKPVAQQLLASLAQYVSAVGAGQPAPAQSTPRPTPAPAATQAAVAQTATPAQPAGWTVISHSVAKGYWLELQPQAPVAIPALLNCARVASGSPAEIKATGYAAVGLPALNYAPALGLYIERGQQGQQGARPPGG